MSAQRRVLDVSMLPDTGEFGHHGLIWWGTVGFMVIEGSMFAIVLVAYFYLRLKVADWPSSLPNPDLTVGTANLLLVLVSCIPNALAKKAAEAQQLSRTRLWLTVVTLFGVGNVILRAFEYPALNCRWDDNAYASITWLLLSLHTTHIITDFLDTLVLTTLMFVGPVEEKRFVDVEENSAYWYFVVGVWLPIYGVIYWAPRLI